jgi:hypothetical protein
MTDILTVDTFCNGRFHKIVLTVTDLDPIQMEVFVMVGSNPVLRHYRTVPTFGTDYFKKIIQSAKNIIEALDQQEFKNNN